jgi:hypothetical protein
MGQTTNTAPFKDECLIHYSAQDGSWIAHGLHTDQVGFGDCVVDAIVDLMVRLRNLSELAQKEKVQIFIEAPEEIQRLCEGAKPLPDCIAQIARERFYHQLSSEWAIHIDIPYSECVTTPLSFEESQT